MPIVVIVFLLDLNLIVVGTSDSIIDVIVSAGNVWWSWR